MKIKLNYIPKYDELSSVLRPEEYLGIRSGAIVEVSDEAYDMLKDLKLFLTIDEEVCSNG